MREDSKAAGRGRVLILESDRLIRALIVEWVQIAGHDAVCAADAEIAARISRRGDVILVDVPAPCESAREVVAHVARRMPGHPVIAMSADALACGQASADALARELGAAAILVKPFTRKALFEALERVRS
jgi:CheY-like chemotaxis protein